MPRLAPVDVEWPRPSKQTMALTAGTSLGHDATSTFPSIGALHQTARYRKQGERWELIDRA